MTVRPHLQEWLRRELLLEAGHRCAIPACRQWPVQIAHIKSRAQSADDSFDNLIVLCSRCHDLYDRYQAIRPIEMRAYKRNLEVLGEETGSVRRRFHDLELWQLLELYGFPWPAARRVSRDQDGVFVLPGGCGKTYIFMAMQSIYRRHRLSLTHRVVPPSPGSRL
ncbi:HNH endonuclease signature motif containing protein [Micromonospora tarensis]|uniref:HNH endonuclease n=1 Tax=Micromonospora tarensis TaxID=2806100 RepID=A0ABS1YAV0_9ACTN|nr:HNH endonuclease signature motif containing protein [Micromonospora tarensis]MBM0274523.1 HNH endonuclease [Micromonospora tarensis]